MFVLKKIIEKTCHATSRIVIPSKLFLLREKSYDKPVTQTKAAPLAFAVRILTRPIGPAIYDIKMDGKCWKNVGKIQ